MTTPVSPAAVWHDVECGAYRTDLPLWSRLAAAQGDPILDVGAGTGRVALELAGLGHDVTALDRDGELLAELLRRANHRRAEGGALRLRTVIADAREFELQERFALIAVPMQTIQLLGGAAGRDAFLRRAAGHLRRGGRVAIALTEQFELYEVSDIDLQRMPKPDVGELGGVVFRSHPTAVRTNGETIVLERRRERISATGRRLVEAHRISLDRLTSAQLEHEARAAGLRPSARIDIPATDDHVGSVVVVLDA